MKGQQANGKRREQEAGNTSNPMDEVSNSDSIEPEIEPLSGKKPYVLLIVSKTQVKPRYQMILPRTFGRLLPSAVVPLEMVRDGKVWKMTYRGEHEIKKTLDNISWREFVDDNGIEVGDACVFELLESSSKLIKLKAQILRGRFPTELRERVNGETIDTAIVIDD